jgi:hypothetical protein
MSPPSYAISRLIVRAEVNTEQLKQFLEKHTDEVPSFAVEFPVVGFDDAALEAAWGTTSLAGVAAPRRVTPFSVVYTFRTACTPPIKWVTRVAKRYPDLSFDLSYALKAMVLTGYIRVHGGITETYECEGQQEDVDNFLLMVE